MNERLHYAMYFYLVIQAVRDSIEYTQVDKKDYVYNAYEGKKETIKRAIDEKSIFTHFCKQNGEVGDQIMKMMKDLYDLLYSDTSRFVRFEEKEGNKIIIPDYSQNIKLLDLVIPLHLSLTNILRSHYDHLAEDDKDKDCDMLIKLESKYFACISNFILAKLLFVDRFGAFNKAMKENNGQENVEANFVISEMQKLAGIHNWIKDHEGKDVEEYTRQEEYFQHSFKVTSGELKPNEGKTIFDEVKIDIDEITKILASVEVSYKQLHMKVFNEMVAFEKSVMDKVVKN